MPSPGSGPDTVAGMILSQGQEMVAIPGPSIVPDRVRAAMARPMPNIYAGALVKQCFELLGRLPAIARSSATAFMAVANGHGAWQMALANTLRPGDKVLVLESGHFAALWGEYAALAGVDVEVLPGDARRPVDPGALQARLEADTEGSIKALLVAHADTMSSVRNDIAAIRAAIDAAGHEALLYVDCIASLACDPFEMDDWGVDVAVGASQKGLMCPPGLAFVWAAEKALARFDPDVPRVGYFDWSSRNDLKYSYDIFAGTPPVSHVYALCEALDMIDEEGGLDAVWARHAALADSVRAAVQAWSSPGGIELNIVSPAHRSNAVTTVRTGGIDADELRRRCEEQAGLIIGVGMPPIRDRSFRIGHMGWLNPPMMLGTITTIEAALRSMGAPLGASGADAAAESIGRSLSA